MFKFLAVFTCLLALSHALYPYAEKDNIINLGDPTWETAINEFPAGLVVYFYEPYCYPCRQFWPELHKTAQDLVAVGSAAKITKVECHDEIKLCNSRQVFTFPTVLLHKGWRSFEYRGARNAEAFTGWLRTAVDHVYPTINSEDDLFKRSSIIILLKDNGSAGAVNDAIMDLLDLDVEVAIAGSAVSSKLGSNNVVILSQAGDSVPVTGADVVAQVNTLRDKKTVAPDITWPVYQQLKGNDAQDYAIFFRTNSFKSGNDAAKAFDKAYPEFFNQNINFYYANVVGDLLGDTLAQHFGVHADDEPTVGLVSQKDRILQKYKLSGAVTFDSIKQLIQDWKAGTGKRYYMTAEVPAGQSGYIKDLVSQTYYEATNDPKKSTLVMFYYPWCEPCVKLEPTWKALAYRLRDNDSVVIARLDISTNDVEGRDIADCPKIFFYPAGDSKTVAEYTGELNVKGLKSFLFDKIPSLKTDMEL